jgi:ankyrin repeat protein
MARRARPRFHGPAADSALGEAFLDALPIVAAVGFAADVSQCVQLCGATFRAGDRGATNDMLVQSLRLQCGARAARAAGREGFVLRAKDPADEDDEDDLVENTTQLIRAAILNNLPRVLQLIQLGAPLDLVGETWGFSALHWASYLGHEHVAKALLDGKHEGRGATVDLRTKGSTTALVEASYYGHESVVRLLLAHGAKQELKFALDLTPLHYAVLGNRPAVIALLCTAPGAAAALAIKTSATFGSRTPLSYAIHHGRAACEAVLRAHGATE